MSSKTKFRMDNIGNKCSFCKKKKFLEVHHIIPISKGGKSTQKNSLTLCRECHKRLHGKKKKSPKRLIVIIEKPLHSQAKCKAYSEGKTIKNKIEELLHEWLKK